MSPLVAKPSRQYRKDLKLVKKQGRDIAELDAIVSLLVMRAALPERCKDHPLHGTFAGYRECHVRPDWLLVYRVVENVLVLVLQRTGTHSEIFGL